MSELLAKSHGWSDPQADWDYREFELDQDDLKLIVAALWVASRDLDPWASHSKTRVEKLRRFFNQPHGLWGQVCLWTREPAPRPSEST